jgi:hypothetical protein
VIDASTQSIEAPRSGQFVVRIIDDNGCRSQSDPILVQIAAVSCTLSLPDLLARPGDHVSIPIILAEADRLTESGAARVNFQIVFDKTVLYPSTGRFVDSAGVRKVALSGSVVSTGEPVATLEGLALWGAVEETPLRLENVQWDTDDVLVKVSPGRLRLDLCREGGVRLYHTSGQTTILGSKPNPFNAVTVIDYELGEEGPMELVVHDALGRRVAVLVSGEGQPGVYRAVFNASSFASGIFFVVLRSGTVVAQHQLILVK